MAELDKLAGWERTRAVYSPDDLHPAVLAPYALRCSVLDFARQISAFYGGE